MWNKNCAHRYVNPNSSIPVMSREPGIAVILGYRSNQVFPEDWRLLSCPEPLGTCCSFLGKVAARSQLQIHSRRKTFCTKRKGERLRFVCSHLGQWVSCFLPPAVATFDLSIPTHWYQAVFSNSFHTDLAECLYSRDSQLRSTLELPGKL